MVLVLGPEAAGRRLDRALADRLPQHSRTQVAAWIAEGRVRVDGRVRAASARVAGGETVRVGLPPPRPSGVRPEAIDLCVLHEDEHLLVLDKPAGLTVHPGHGRPGGTLANALVHRFGLLPQAGGADRPGIVHRLDRDTSGVIVVARTERVQRALSAAFAARQVAKTYWACVHGTPALDEGVVERPIARHPRERTRMAVVPGGRDAWTRWTVLRRLPRHALLRVEPRTGRTHQIRVHLASLRHPIVGDPLYGNPRLAGEEHAPRLMLHALALAFRHPVTGATLRCEAPWPAQLERALDALAALPEPPRRARR